MLLIAPTFAATIAVGTDYATINEAITAAGDGDTLLVPGGTWTEALDLRGKSLTIEGAGEGTTFLAPVTTDDVVRVADGAEVTLSGLTILPAGGRGVVVIDSVLHAAQLTVDHGGSAGARGGGIAIDGGTADLIEVTLSASTGAYGGHLYVTGGGTLTALSLNLSDGAATYGGAIYANGGSTLDLTDVVATGSYANYDGGFAWFDDADVTAVNLTVDAPSSHAGAGIGLYVVGYSQLRIDGGILTNAALDSELGGADGGAIFLGEGSTATLTDLVLTNNVADAGGGLYAEDSAHLTLDRVYFVDNLADTDGGALRAVGSTVVEATDCVFEGNLADNGAGASIEDGSTLTDSGSTWAANEASGTGGGLILRDAVATLDASIFSANTAVLAGGGVYVDDSTLTATDLELWSNRVSAGDGGGLYVAGGDVTLDAGRIEGNEASLGSGGGVWSAGTMELSGPRLTENTALRDGGALWLRGAASLWEGTLFWNSAGGDGGAIYATDDVTLARSYLYANDADNGGAICIDGPTAGAMTNLRVTDNVATGDGGGVWIGGASSAQYDVINNTFAGNEAGGNGGHVYTEAAVEFVDNILYQAIDGGGAYGTTESSSDRFYNLAWDNAGGDWAGWSDPTGSSGNLAVDPGLVAYTADHDVSDDDLFLTASSPAINAGSPSIFDADGTRADIGAFGGPDADVQDADDDGFYDSTDCDDTDTSVHPWATEIPYDAIDQDCDGSDLEDLDGDGFGASDVGGGDCDDDDASIHPEAIEIWYDGIDTDCSGTSDYDQDGDWHDAATYGGDDCDDLDPARHGAAVEVWYDGIDQDCDGWSDYDRDRDGYDAQAWGGEDCDDYSAERAPEKNEIPYDGIDQDCSGDDLVDVDGDGWIAEQAGGTDCDDAEDTVYPGAYEDPLDGFDTDCDGFSEWDRDGDGFDAIDYGGGDCDDFDATANPDAIEVWYDGVDQDCDDRDDDQDRDGYLLADDCDDTDPAINPDATELDNGIDDDCDGLSDDDDQDGDGLNEFDEATWDTDPTDADSDDDSLLDGQEIAAGPDQDEDGVVDALDPDDDGDGINTRDELKTDTTIADVDDDGLINAWDLDSDGDGVTDATEGRRDRDGDGVRDYLDYQGDLTGGGCGGGWAGLIFLPLSRLRWLFALVLGLLPGRARATDAHGFTLMGTSGDPKAFTRLGQALTVPAKDWAAGLVFDYADTPVAELLPAGRTPVIGSLATANVAGSYSFGWLTVDAVLPVHIVGTDQGGNPFTAFGDAQAGLHVPFFAQDGLRPAVAGQVRGFFPTGDDAHYVGSVSPRVAASVTGQSEFGSLGLVAMLGAEVGASEQDRNLTGGVGPFGGLGASWAFSDAITAQAEIASQGSLGAFPVEAGLGGRLRLDNGVWATLGASAGLGEAVGASRWRAYAGVGFSSHKKPVPVAVVAPETDPDGDRDGDGIKNSVDHCPDQAETVDGFADQDGCPEFDGDGDGVPFDRDECKSEPILPEQDPRWSDGCPQVAEFAGDRIVITEAIFFTEGRAELLPSAERVLGAVRDVMQIHTEVPYFLVEGHTNSNGPDEFNQRLSDARAYRVATWLVEHGVDASRLLSKGFGESRPMVDASHPDALAIDRRVEFRVVDVEQVPLDARRLELPPEVRE